MERAAASRFGFPPERGLRDTAKEVTGLWWL
jgi:hypothetical protein